MRDANLVRPAIDENHLERPLIVVPSSRKLEAVCHDFRLLAASLVRQRLPEWIKPL
jgi:hypothetical protein